MNTTQTDQQALASAQARMGEFAWPTVILGVTVMVAYLATVLAVAQAWLPLWAGTLLVMLLTYMAYTVVHEAVHGSINGRHQNLRWVNEWLGYGAAWIMMIPLTAHRHEHLAHHRHTNDPDADPDYAVANLTRTPWQPLLAVSRITLGQYRYYFANRWGKGKGSQDRAFCLELLASIGLRLAFMAQGFWLEGFMLFIVGGLGGILITMYLFAYLVHHPHQDQGRYVDTSTFEVQGGLGKVITTLWLYQNYHSIHHLFPRVPFYRYREVFDEIRPVMESKHAPIERLFWPVSADAGPA
ncbi:MAG: fatty acid desaturase [Halieaceae bacterium]